MNQPVESTKSILDRHLPKDDRPVVCYSGIWTLASAYSTQREELAHHIYHELKEVVGPRRTLLMPTYTQRPSQGVLNLDTTPGMTGMVNECLRQDPHAKRTASAFFSFAAIGPDAEYLSSLRPQDAWGDGSVFEYIERKNAHIVMLGVPIEMCSFLHRLEWNTKVPYRYTKDFETAILLDGEPERLKERLFVRSLDPAAENVWPQTKELFLKAGMISVRLGRGEILITDAETLMSTLSPKIEADPFSFVKNADQIRQHFSHGRTSL